MLCEPSRITHQRNRDPKRFRGKEEGNNSNYKLEGNNSNYKLEGNKICRNTTNREIWCCAAKTSRCLTRSSSP